MIKAKVQSINNRSTRRKDETRWDKVVWHKGLPVAFIHNFRGQQKRGSFGQSKYQKIYNKKQGNKKYG